MHGLLLASSLLPALLAQVAVDTAAAPPGHNGVAWTLVGTGIALVIIGVFFLIKKAVYAVLSIALIIFSSVLLLVAVLGEPLGIYPRIHRWWLGEEEHLVPPELDPRRDEVTPGTTGGTPPSPPG